MPGGVLLGVLGAGARPVLQILTLFQTKKNVIFHTGTGARGLLSTLVFSAGLCEIVLIITYKRTPTKRFLKLHFDFPYYTLFLIHLELKGQISSNIPPYPIPHQNGQQAETAPFGKAHTYITYMKEYTPLPPQEQYLIR